MPISRPQPHPARPPPFPQVQLPLQDSEVDAGGYDDERGEVGGFGSAHGKVGAAQGGGGARARGPGWAGGSMG